MNSHACGLQGKRYTSMDSKVLVWLSASLLSSLYKSFSSKETGLRGTLNTLKESLFQKWRVNVMNKSYRWSQVLTMLNLVDNKQLMLTAPTVHCSLPSCILPCLVQLFGWAVLEHDLVLKPDYDWECAKSLYTRWKRSLRMTE